MSTKKDSPKVEQAEPTPEATYQEALWAVSKSTRLRFTPFAWEQLQNLLTLSEAKKTEIGGFGVTPKEADLVEELVVLPQESCGTHIDFDDGGIADYLDACVKMGFQPWQVTRVWWHTHPSMAASPSGTDNSTFRQMIGEGADWGYMVIIGTNHAMSVTRLSRQPREDTVQASILHPALPKEEIKRLEKEVEDRVRQKVVVNVGAADDPYTYSHRHGGWVDTRFRGSGANRRRWAIEDYWIVTDAAGEEGIQKGNGRIIWANGLHPVVRWAWETQLLDEKSVWRRFDPPLTSKTSADNDVWAKVKNELNLTREVLEGHKRDYYKDKKAAKTIVVAAGNPKKQEDKR